MKRKIESLGVLGRTEDGLWENAKSKRTLKVARARQEQEGV